MSSLDAVPGRLMLAFGAFTCIVSLILFYCLRNMFRSGLKHIPGPLLAHATSLYRIKLVWKGGAVKNYTALHKEYGDIVRTGGNHVSVADPAAIPLIYGIASRYDKVSVK